MLSSDKSEACQSCRGAKRGDLLEIEYTGKLEDGTVFDGSSVMVSCRGSSRRSKCSEQPISIERGPSSVPACSYTPQEIAGSCYQSQGCRNCCAGYLWVPWSQVNGKELPGRAGDKTLFFVLGKQPRGQFPPGWDLLLIDMCVGETRVISVPPVLGYGSRGFPRRGVPPDATLLYDVKLIGVNGVNMCLS